MKEEVTRIMRLVKEGKLSPEDAAELIEAFSDAPEEEMAEPERVTAGAAEEAAHAAEEDTTKKESDSKKSENPFASLVGAIEGIAKDVATKVDWNDIASQVREGVGKGVDAVKKAAEDAKVGQGFGFLFGNTESKVVEMPLHVPEGKTLRVEGSSGSISVVGTQELGQFRVKAHFRATSSEDAKNKAALYSPVIEETEQHVILKLQEGPDSHIEATINTSPGTPVDIRTASGSIVARDLTASVRVTGASADFEGSGLKGSLEISLASGDVSLSGSETSMATIETKSGDVHLKQTRGVMNIRTSSGDVRLSEGSGRNISIDAASGDVTLDLDRPIDGTVNVRAVSGSIQLDAADGSDARVSLSTLQGDITCGFELEDKNQSSGKLTGKLGSGMGQIDLSTVSGDVNLSMRGSLVKEEVVADEGPKIPDAPEPPKPPEAPSHPE